MDLHDGETAHGSMFPEPAKPTLSEAMSAAVLAAEYAGAWDLAHDLLDLWAFHGVDVD